MGKEDGELVFNGYWGLVGEDDIYSSIYLELYDGDSCITMRMYLMNELCT